MKFTYWGGVISALIILGGTLLVDNLNDYDAIKMINASQPTIRFMCSSVMTATATILALLLTLLSFSVSREEKLKASHYERLQTIAKLSSATFIAATIGLMLLSIPFTEAEGDIKAYFNVIYYVMQVYAAVMGGALITIVLMLYLTAKMAIMLVHPKLDASSYLADEEEE